MRLLFTGQSKEFNQRKEDEIGSQVPPTQEFRHLHNERAAHQETEERALAKRNRHLPVGHWFAHKAHPQTKTQQGEAANQGKKQG